MSEETQSPKEQIVAYALKKRAAAIGVADVDLIERFAPEGFGPRDLLPQARSVIAIGMTGATAGTWAASAKVMAYNGGTVGPVYRIASGLSYFIEGRFGYRSIMCPAHVDPEAGSRMPMQSIKLQAELAGIGARSMAGGILLHPDFGMLYYASVITEMPLPADAPMAENPCPADSCVAMWRSTGQTPCQKFCPVEALSGSIDADGKCEEMVFQMHRCAEMCQQYEIMPNVLARAMNAADPLEREHALFAPEVQGYMYKVTTGIGATNAQCFECMRVCPVVSKAPLANALRRGRRTD